MPPRQLEDPADVDRALAAPCFLLFKHSLVCPVSHRAFAEYVAFCEQHPDTPTAWVDVIGQRPLSQRIAAHTGVEHASPQAILVREGAATWNASHGAITRTALADVLAPS